MLTPSDAAKQKGVTSTSSTINNKVIISGLESFINTIFHFFSCLILISWQVTAKSCAYPLSRVICSQRHISCHSLMQSKRRQLSFYVTSQKWRAAHSSESHLANQLGTPPSFPSGNRRNLLIVAIKKSSSFLGARVVSMSTHSQQGSLCGSIRQKRSGRGESTEVQYLPLAENRKMPLYP